MRREAPPSGSWVAGSEGRWVAAGCGVCDVVGMGEAPAHCTVKEDGATTRQRVRCVGVAASKVRREVGAVAVLHRYAKVAKLARKEARRVGSGVDNVRHGVAAEPRQALCVEEGGEQEAAVGAGRWRGLHYWDKGINQYELYRRRRL